jgi:hypothetical protein
VRCGEKEIQSVEYDEFQAIQTILTKQSILLESEEISQENPIPQRHDMHIIESISPRTLKSKNLMNQDNFGDKFLKFLLFRGWCSTGVSPWSTFICFLYQ